MTTPEMFESGLQPERTTLAWRRTLIALLVGSVVSYRVLGPTLGGWSIVVGTTGLVVTVTTWVLAGRRGRAFDRTLRTGILEPGGGLLLLLAGTVAAAAAIGLLYVLG